MKPLRLPWLAAPACFDSVDLSANIAFFPSHPARPGPLNLDVAIIQEFFWLSNYSQQFFEKNLHVVSPIHREYNSP